MSAVRSALTVTVHMVTLVLILGPLDRLGVPVQEALEGFAGSKDHQEAVFNLLVILLVSGIVLRIIRAATRSTNTMRYANTATLEARLMRTQNSLASRRTRVHEAGHAVVALNLGLTLDLISVNPEGNTLGRIVVCNYPEGHTSNQGLWADAVIRTAGITSERLVLGDGYATGASDDFNTSQHKCLILAAAGFSPVEGKTFTGAELLQFAQETALDILTKNRESIERLEEQLAITPILKGKDVAELLAK